MSLTTRIGSFCICAAPLWFIGCGQSSTSSSQTVPPVTSESSGKAAQAEVNRGMDQAKKSMDQMGYQGPGAQTGGANMPQFQMPTPPPGVKVGPSSTPAIPPPSQP